jgi:hypothetical protein
MILIVAIAALGIQFNAHAGLVGTERVIAAEQGMLDRSELLAALDRVEVREQLIALGVDPVAARDRVAALSDHELLLMAERLDQLPAGGVNSVVGALVFIFIVLLVTDLLGLTNVFPFVK